MSNVCFWPEWLEHNATVYQTETYWETRPYDGWAEASMS